jgi:hypothetical protein
VAARLRRPAGGKCVLTHRLCRCNAPRSPFTNLSRDSCVYSRRVARHRLSVEPSWLHTVVRLLPHWHSESGTSRTNLTLRRPPFFPSVFNTPFLVLVMQLAQVRNLKASEIVGQFLNTRKQLFVRDPFRQPPSPLIPPVCHITPHRRPCRRNRLGDALCRTSSLWYLWLEPRWTSRSAWCRC